MEYFKCFIKEVIKMKYKYRIVFTGKLNFPYSVECKPIGILSLFCMWRFADYFETSQLAHNYCLQKMKENGLANHIIKEFHPKDYV